MEVILRTDVEKIGKAGTVVKVKDGFARNFLIPNNLALPVTAANLKSLEQDKEKRRIELEKKKQEALSLSSRLGSFSLTIPALTQEEEKLYGSIGAQEIAAALKEEGFEVEKNCLLLDEPIKKLGIYEVPVRLHPEVNAKIKLWIVKK